MRRDLGIGGCWNEAVFSEHCGRYAVQLDSDDLYANEKTVQMMIDEFHRNNFAMVIGSYTLVDMNLEELPPGIIDHREWTPANGRNNALELTASAHREHLIRQCCEALEVFRMSVTARIMRRRCISRGATGSEEYTNRYIFAAGGKGIPMRRCQPIESIETMRIKMFSVLWKFVHASI